MEYVSLERFFENFYEIFGRKQLPNSHEIMPNRDKRLIMRIG